jgi:threonine dehydrogenase-like Zn-dependent dehydrogenase
VVRFEAAEHRADGSLGTARYEIDGSTQTGWRLARDDAPYLELGPGYRLLRTSHCGICSTDLARHRLPFPLPQVTGHEIVARDDDGRLVAVEINASHAARALPTHDWCALCRTGLPTHCPERLVLGIHALPGGFAPWILAPVGAVVPLPEALDPLEGTLLEPFAAAWHAVQTIAPFPGDVVAVLGVGRLGSLLVAALAAQRERGGGRSEIVAVARGAGAERARRLGADRVLPADEAPRAGRIADVVIEASGTPDGLVLALGLARREVHLKSTTGRPAAGLAHATELVVDELRLVPGHMTLRGVPIATSLAEIDAAIRPDPGVERSAVGPRGAIAVAASATASEPLLHALGTLGMHVTSSRCGDFRDALPPFAWLAARPERPLRSLITHVLPATRLADGYATASRPDAVKVVMQHDVA